MLLQMEGDTARPWPSIVEFYERLIHANDAFRDIAGLVFQIAASPFPAAGLCAQTSMHTLILGPSLQVLANPHLEVRPNFKGGFSFVYQDGSSEPWTRTVPAAEGFDALVRFLTKRARWYRGSV